jgi:hypothetical protein
MAAKTHTILIAGGSGLVGHAAIKLERGEFRLKRTLHWRDIAGTRLA